MICMHSLIQIFIHSIYHLSPFFSVVCFLVSVFLLVKTDQAILKPDLAVGAASEVCLYLLYRDIRSSI